AFPANVDFPYTITVMIFSSCEMALVVMRQVLIFWLLSLQLQFTSPPNPSRLVSVCALSAPHRS
ncbi:hypothetical protein ACVQMF_004658, partial [Salmonella enterica subsp. enterica serovar Montevideo]